MDSEKKKNRKKQPVLVLENAGGTVGSIHFEQCETFNGNQFFLRHAKGKLLDNAPMIVAQDEEWLKITYKPFDRASFYPFNMKSRNYIPQEYGSVLDLFNEVRQFLYDHWDYFDASYYDVLTAWVLATYLPEKWDFIAYVAVIGDTGTGKSRMINCLAALCYKALLVVDPTEATLFRTVSEWHPTMIIDESETVTRNQRQTVQNLLNAGQKQGSSVQRMQERRVAGGTVRYAPQCFDVFGFKALAGTKMWLPTLRRRALIAYSTRSLRKVNRRIDKDRAREIRRKLLQYRIDYIDIPFKESLAKIDELTHKLTGTYELFFSLFSVTPSAKWDALLKYAMKEEKSRSRERGAGEMAEIFYAILRLKPKDDDLIRLSVIAEYLNRERLAKEQFTSRQIGTIIKQLGFQRKHTRLGTVVIWNEQIVDRLKKQYGSCDEVPKTTETRAVIFGSGNVT